MIEGDEVRGQLAGHALELVSDHYLIAEPDFDGSLEFEIEELAMLRDYLELLMVTCRKAKKAIDREMAEELGVNGGIRIGDRFYQARPSKKFEVDFPEVLNSFIGDDWIGCFNPNSVRLTALKSLAKDRGVPYNAVLDSIGHYERDDGALTVTPMARVPGWASKLKDGQRTIPKALG